MHTLLLLLTFVPTIFASPLVLNEPSSETHLEKRHGNSTGTPLCDAYQNYTYQGCFTNFASKALVGVEDTNFGNLTNQKCIDYCSEKGFPIAGTQSGSQCFCGTNLTDTTLLIEEAACATSCTGNDTQVCGDNQKLSVYATYNVSGTTFDSVEIAREWSWVGCMTEGTNGNRTLLGAAYACLGMTVEMCMDFCDVMGFPVAGLEYGGECYCGDNFQNGGGSCTEGCDMPCVGNDNEFCGGNWVMNVYQKVYCPEPLTRCEEECGC